MRLVFPSLCSPETARPKRLRMEKRKFHGKRIVENVKDSGGSRGSVVNDDCSVVGVVGNDQIVVLEADCLGRHLHFATLAVLL